MRDWLSNIRKDKSMTQVQVANQSFIDRAYYSQIENGTRNPSVETALNIARTLGFNPVDFFDGYISEPYTETLHGSPVVLSHCDLDMNYIWVYNAMAEHKNNELQGKREEDLEIDPCRDSKELMEIKRRVLETGKPVFTSIIVHTDDNKKEYTVFVKPLEDKHGTITGVATVAMEIKG